MKVILVMAITLDGKISRNSYDPVDWTGRDDKKAFVRITKKAGVVIMGSRTFDTIGKVLPGRKNIVLTRDKGRRSDDENLIFTDQDPETLLNDLEQNGYDEAALIGGSLINGIFARKKLVHELYVTLVPKVFGKGLSLFGETLDLELKLEETLELEAGALLLRYKVL